MEPTNQEQDKRIQILKKVPFLEAFSESEMEFLLKLSRWLKLVPGDIVFKEGSAEKSFYIILKGSVSVQKKTGVGTLRKTLGTIDSGRCFGEMSFILGDQRSADIVAATETFLLKVDAETLNKEEDSPLLKSVQYKIYRKFSEIIAERLLQANKELVRPF